MRYPLRQIASTNENTPMQFTKFMNKQIKSTQDGYFWSEQPKPIYRTKPQKKTPNILQIENRWFHLTDLNPMHEVSDLL